MKNIQRYSSLLHSHKSGFASVISVVFYVIAFVVASLVVCYLVSPKTLAKGYNYFVQKPLVVDGLYVKVSNNIVKINPNETLNINPKQIFTILSLKTNRWQNYNLRLYSPNFDVEEFSNKLESKTFYEVLGENVFTENVVYEIQLKDKQKIVTKFNLTVIFSPIDFTVFANSEEDLDKKIHYYKRALALDPNSEIIKEKLYNTFIENELFLEAAEFLELQVNENTSFTNLLNLLNLYRKLNNIEKQIDVLNKIINLRKKENLDTIGYETELAKLYNQANNYSKAAESYENLLKTANEKQAVVYLSQLGKIYRNGGNTEAEIKIWERLVKFSEENEKPAIWAEIIKLHEKLNNETGERSAWQGLAESLPDGTEKANAYKKLGFLWAKAKGYNESISFYEKALESDTNDSIVYLNLAKMYLLNSDNENYYKNIEKVLNLEPNNIEYRLEYAGKLFEDKKFEQAKIEYDRVLKEDSTNKLARIRIISILEQSDNRKQLIEEYEKLLESNSNDKIGFYNLAVLLFKEKLFEKSEKYFNKVLEIDSDDIEAHSYLLAIYKELKKEKEMIIEAQALVKLNPDKTEYLDFLLVYYENNKNWEPLITLLEDLVKIKPENENLYLYLAKIYKSNKNNNKYAVNLHEIAKLKKDNVKMWLEAALAYEADNNIEAAFKIYEKILELEPNNTEAENKVLNLNLKQLNDKK